MPGTASAGIFSFVSDLLHGSKNENGATVVTSQTMPLLQAVLNPNPLAARGGGDIAVVGDEALLPESGPSGTMVDIEEGHSDQISLYVVHSGDTLSQIAKMFGVSVNTIIWANDLTGSTLKPDQQLVILPISGLQYVVRNGDTLKSIAAKYKADINEIVQFNNLKAGEPLSLGITIIIPDGEIQIQKVYRPLTTSRPHGTGGPNLDYYYAAPLTSYVKTQGLHGYNGVDLGAPLGTPIMAAAAGIVIVSKNYGWNGGYGEYVVVAHGNNTQTLYSHMGGDITYPGMSVSKGQVIGYVGITGKSTGPHLHFEVRGARNPF